MPARFGEQAARTPDAIALTCDGESLSYRALDERSNQLAHHLLVQGVAPGTIVGLCVDRSIDMLVGLLGILKAGAAYLPLDPAYPPDRLEYMLTDAGVRHLVAQSALVRPPAAEPISRSSGSIPTPHASPGVPRVPRFDISTRKAPPTSFTPRARPDSPKASSSPITMFFASSTRPGTLFRFGSDDVWTLFHSFAFDFSVWEIWGALLHGGRWSSSPTPPAARRQTSSICSCAKA